MIELVGMKLRQTNVSAVVRALIVAKQSGVTISPADMEAAWIQGVDLEKVTLAMIEAERQKMDLTFQDLVDAELHDRLSGMLNEDRTANLEEMAV